MPNLKSVELIKFFDDNSDVHQRANLLRQMFGESQSEFLHLRRIHLDKNFLATLPGDIFCKMPSLEILSLQNNVLSSFNVEPKCLPGLRELDLSNNEFKFIGKPLINLIENVPHLEKVNFSLNPFDCNCYLTDFINWVKDSERIATKTDVSCDDALPVEFIGADMSDLNPEMLKCPSTGKDYMHTVYIFVALALIGLCLLMACVIYNNKSFLMRIKRDSASGKARYRVVSGYERLDKEEEVKAEFV